MTSKKKKSSTTGSSAEKKLEKGINLIVSAMPKLIICWLKKK